MATWVVVDQKDGNVKKVSLEIIAEAKKAGEVAAVVFGPKAVAAEVAKYGADKVYVVEALAEYNTGAYVSQLAAMVEAEKPAAVLFAHTMNGREVAARLAQKLGLGLATDVVGMDLAAGEFTRAPYGGKVLAQVKVTTAPVMATVRPGVFEAAENAAAGEVVEAAAAFEADAKKVLGFEAAVSARPDLTEAAVIVSAGRGAKGPEGVALVESLADMMGAAVGGSRAAVDAGWMTHDLQVGQTGKTVNPGLYLACGISGAIQHLAGMSASKYVATINTDEEAPIFSITDFGVVGDMFKVIPALKDALKK